MLGNFNLPCVDHLREGIDYRVVDWDFADAQPAAPPISHTPGTPCPDGTKMIFGLCRKVKPGTESDWSADDQTDEEKKLSGEAQKAGSDVKTNKAFESGGKKFGWAIKGGKPVIVEWGSVAGTKEKPNKPAGKQEATATTGPSAAAAPAAAPGKQAPATPAQEKP